MRRAAPAAVAVLVAGCGGSGAPAPGPAVPPTGPVAPAASPARPRPGETLGAEVLRATALRAAPRPGAGVLARAQPHTRFGSRTILAVVAARGRWLEVLSDALPNGRRAWIAAADARLLRETWAIRVDLSARRAVVLHRGRRYRSFPVAVGAPGTATPTGRFGVTDRLTTGGPGSGYGCCVLALTAHQPDVPQDWPGGDRIAIHGTSAPASIGTAASHGCLRASAAAMRLLMDRIPLGTPVVIRD